MNRYDSHHKVNNLFYWIDKWLVVWGFIFSWTLNFTLYIKIKNDYSTVVNNISWKLIFEIKMKELGNKARNNWCDIHDKIRFICCLKFEYELKVAFSIPFRLPALTCTSFQQRIKLISKCIDFILNRTSQK
jgi:hypothetical protein